MNYVQNVAQFFLSQKITDKQLYAMEPEDVITLLTQIKGVGKLSLNWVGEWVE